MHKTFSTEQPVRLYVEIGKGRVELTATGTTQTSVEVTGDDVEDVTIEQQGDEIRVLAPRVRVGFFKSDPQQHIHVTVPTSSECAVRSSSADVTAEGIWGATQVKTGSGEIRFDQIADAAVLESGSGDIGVDQVSDSLRVKTGSGDLSVGEVQGSASISTGSGDIEIGRAGGPTVVKTGSGDLRIAHAEEDVTMSTGSGDTVVERFTRGRITVRGASGDVAVGIPAGTPVWTDLSTVSGRLRSDLDPVGAPKDGADHVELRAKTASGSITLHQL